MKTYNKILNEIRYEDLVYNELLPLANGNMDLVKRAMTYCAGPYGDINIKDAKGFIRYYQHKQDQI